MPCPLAFPWWGGRIGVGWVPWWSPPGATPPRADMRDFRSDYLFHCRARARRSLDAHGSARCFATSAGAMSALLSDLMHLAEYRETDFASALLLAREHYAAEKAPGGLTDIVEGVTS